MTALILFFVILSALVIVHELGHFAVAKISGIRVDEFGLGYPPRALKLFKWKDTLFSLNWLPFGGFVKIFGENYLENEANNSPASFQHKNRGIQAAVLIAGVLGNFLFAWFLLSVGFMTGLPAPEGLNWPVKDAQTTVTEVLADSPADRAGLKTGDVIVSLAREGERFASALSPETVSTFIRSSSEPVVLKIKRGEEPLEKTIKPKSGIWAESPAIGVAMESVGTVELPFWFSIGEGLRTSISLTAETARGLGWFIWQAAAGKADFSGVAGPIGLVGLVGDASKLGFGHLVVFTALISINLCLINLMPFPALDGGRLLFVAVEALTRKQIPARVFNAVNSAGFALLILLMILITIHDVRNIF